MFHHSWLSIFFSFQKLHFMRQPGEGKLRLWNLWWKMVLKWMQKIRWGYMCTISCVCACCFLSKQCKRNILYCSDIVCHYTYMPSAGLSRGIKRGLKRPPYRGKQRKQCLKMSNLLLDEYKHTIQGRIQTDATDAWATFKFCLKSVNSNILNFYSLRHDIDKQEWTWQNKV